jgi:hypothetical protein
MKPNVPATSRIEPSVTPAKENPQIPKMKIAVVPKPGANFELKSASNGFARLPTFLRPESPFPAIPGIFRQS